jgi:hypothetical protein
MDFFKKFPEIFNIFFDNLVEFATQIKLGNLPTILKKLLEMITIHLREFFVTLIEFLDKLHD